MSGLSPRALELVQAGRVLCRPTSADRRRIQNALRARLGAAALPAEVMGVSLAVRLHWSFAASAIVAATLLGGALLLARQREPEATNPPSAVPAPPAATVSAAWAAATAADSATAPELPATVSSEPVARSAPPVEDSLAQEVALLSQATGDLHAGRASNALKVLAEHQRQFPNGILNEERRAARVQALCLLGRQREARTEPRRGSLAQSPSAARAKQVYCELQSGSAEERLNLWPCSRREAKKGKGRTPNGSPDPWQLCCLESAFPEALFRPNCDTLGLKENLDVRFGMMDAVRSFHRSLMSRLN